MSTANPNIANLVPACSVCITYTAFTDEPDPISLPVFFGARIQIERLPQDRDSDPFKTARDLTKIYDGRSVAILVPGKRFDQYGYRLGRGGGWYDRFLGVVPANWLRVGVGQLENFLADRLEVRSWDQSMDWLLLCQDGVWQARRCDNKRTDTDHLLDGR